MSDETEVNDAEFIRRKRYNAATDHECDCDECLIVRITNDETKTLRKLAREVVANRDSLRRHPAQSYSILSDAIDALGSCIELQAGAGQ